MSELFTEPVDFNEALLRREVRDFVSTELSHEQLKVIGSQVRERSLMMARVTNVEFGQRVIDVTNQVVEGKMSGAMARRRLSELLGQMGYEAEPGEEGTIKDLRSDARLNLIIRMQVQMAHGFGQWRMRQTESELWANPCQELYRAYQRKEPRDWITRWQDAGGELYDGRMVAPVNAMIWTGISAFGLPYPPFDFNSGMDLKPVSREEAIGLGVISEHQVVHPQKRDFEDDASATLPALSKEMEGVLVDSLGEGWTYENGVLHKANERLILQLLNNDFLADNNVLEEVA